MRKTKSVAIEGGEDLIVRELSVREIRGLLDRMEAGDAPGETVMIDLLFPGRMPSIALAQSLGLTDEELAEANFPPSVIEQLLEEAEAINPTFAGLLKRLADIGLAEAARASAKRSTGAAAG